MLTGSGPRGLKESSFKKRKKKKKVRMCCSFPPTVTSSTFLQRLAGDEGTWPSCLLAEQFISSGSVYILHSCGSPQSRPLITGAAALPVLNISTNHGPRQVRNEEAVKPDGGQFCRVYVIYY